MTKKIYHLENTSLFGGKRHKYYSSLPKLLQYNDIGVSLRTIRKHQFEIEPFKKGVFIVFKGFSDSEFKAILSP